MQELSIQEEKELETFEGIIENSLRSFYDMGHALKIIRDNRLYRENFNTFEEYCQNKWKLNRAHCYRLIDSTGVMNNLYPIGDRFPESESQARPLTTLKNADEQIAVWSMVVEKHGGNITAKDVADEVAKFKGIESKENSSLEYRIVSYLGPMYYKIFQNIKRNMECTEAELVRQFVKDGIETTDISYKRAV